MGIALLASLPPASLLSCALFARTKPKAAVAAGYVNPDHIDAHHVDPHHAGPDHVDPDYAAALVAADRFLTAWQSHDQETGVLLLSNSAKRHGSEERLQAFFSQGNTQEAFEIAHGKKVRAGHYSFPVTLFGLAGGSRAAPPRHVQLLVARTGKDDWAVDRLP